MPLGPRLQRGLDAVPPAAGIALGGVSLGCCSLYHVAIFHVPQMPAVQTRGVFVLKSIELLGLALPPVVIIAAAVGLWRSDSPGTGRPDQWVVFRWYAGATILVTGAVGLTKLHRWLLTSDVYGGILQMELLTAAGLGGLLGILVGQKAARLRVRTSHLRDQRDAFAVLNRALRHNILNSVQVIDGYTGMARERLAADDEHVVAPIEERSAEIQSFVNNVEGFAATFSGDAQRRDVNVRRVVESAVEDARLTFPGAAFDTTLPDDDVLVRGNNTIRLAIDELLRNLVRRNSRDTPQVTVRVERTGEEVAIHLSDDSAGVPETSVTTLADGDVTGDTVLDLSLVERVMSYHGGTVSFGVGRSPDAGVEVLLPIHETARQEEP